MIECPCCWAHSSNQNLPITVLRDQRQIRRWAEANRLRSKRNYRILTPPSWSSRPHLSRHHRWLSWARQDCQVSVLATYIVHLKQFAHAPPELSFLHYSVRVETLRDQIRELLGPSNQSLPRIGEHVVQRPLPDPDRANCEQYERHQQGHHRTQPVLSAGSILVDHQEPKSQIFSLFFQKSSGAA